MPGLATLSPAPTVYVSGLHGTVGGTDEFRDGLTTVVRTALRNRTGIEGGIWRGGRESLAYAFPTYEGTGPKTDLPQAELPWIQQVNQSALREEHRVESRYQAASQTLLLTACPLPGAEEIGYESEAAFSRAFKKLVGVSPSVWRRRAPSVAAEVLIK